MKIAYGNYGMPHTPPEVMVGQIADIGYDGVELCTGPSYPTAPGQLTASAREALRRAAHKLSVPARIVARSDEH